MHVEVNKNGKIFFNTFRETENTSHGSNGPTNRIQRNARWGGGGKGGREAYELTTPRSPCMADLFRTPSHSNAAACWQGRGTIHSRHTAPTKYKRARNGILSHHYQTHRIDVPHV